jgi:hypothetical protein
VYTLLISFDLVGVHQVATIEHLDCVPGEHAASVKAFTLGVGELPLAGIGVQFVSTKYSDEPDSVCRSQRPDVRSHRAAANTPGTSARRIATESAQAVVRRENQ